MRDSVLRHSLHGQPTGRPFRLDLYPEETLVKFDWQLRGKEEYSVWGVVPQVPDEEEPQPRTLIIVGTGWELPEGDWKYVGTAKAPDNFHMWHLFEQMPEGS